MSVNCLSQINQKIVQDFIKNKKTVTTKPKTSPAKKIDKQKLTISIAAEIGIAALIIGGIIYQNSKAIKNLAKYIEFNKAQTIEDAIKFGIDNLGIKKYTGFKETDLDIINWINEGLVNIHNVTKTKVKMPNHISIKEEMQGAFGSMDPSGLFSISRQSITDAKNLAIDIKKIVSDIEYNEACDFIKKQELGDIYDYIGKYAKFNPSFARKIAVYHSRFSFISHEVGHLQHFNNIDLYLFIAFHNGKGKTPKQEKILELFKNSENIAQKVSEYAKESPMEFVAECYAKMIDGIKLDNNIIKLYKKLGGVMV